MVTVKKTLDVDQLTARIQALLLQDPVLQSVNLRGEILELKKHTSGHVYFTLSGKESRISCVMFRSDASSLPRWPRKGDEVVVQGRVSIYPPRGSYQFYARQIFPLGEGAAARARAELKARLEKEGIFDGALKKVFPEFPQKTAVITSPTGAAVRDVIKVSGKLFPVCSLVIVPALVQGADAPADISSAFLSLSKVSGLDSVLLVRGGGSRDDLNPFDDESVIRAVRNCPFPVMTGLGHQSDLTLSDLAADAYASTPSAAAEQLLPDISDIRRRLDTRRDHMTSRITSDIDFKLYSISILRNNATKAFTSLLNDKQQSLTTASARLSELTGRIVSDWSQKVENIRSRLKVLSPEDILNRGFILCEDIETGEIISEFSKVKEGCSYLFTFSGGKVIARVENKLNPGDIK